MNEFLKMDIFFFVTTVIAVIFGVLGAYVLWRVGRILTHIEHISEAVVMESALVRQDLAELRENIRGGGGRIRPFFSFFKKWALRNKKK
ncbi:MAG: hypothetical protein AAB442_01905 [Patescibacteria group bacterium]